ncbi:MAG: hypothetical protein Ct9H90mP14_0920 [Methanobacteriota archaeon]|nr:MAG: hypothetical protein Ct9H90mP14_0920 [Euryarchaeota archaeon]
MNQWFASYRISELRFKSSALPLRKARKVWSRKALLCKKHRVVRLAHESGWYEVPKRTSFRDLADKLGFSQNKTVAEQLVKAEGEIVAFFP